MIHYAENRRLTLTPGCSQGGGGGGAQGGLEGNVAVKRSHEGEAWAR